MELPIKIEGIMYAVKDGGVKFLILKRSQEDGDFWQPLTGTLEEGETLKGCLLRELKEETGIEKVVKVSDEVWRFNWLKGNDVITEFVFGIELYPGSEITLDPKEHSDFGWYDFNEAVDMLGRENNKKAFEIFYNKLQVKL